MVTAFQNLDAIPFKVYAGGQAVYGTITPTGHVLPDGMPSAFSVKLPGQKALNISTRNGVWVMPGPDELALELGVWIELHYQCK